MEELSVLQRAHMMRTVRCWLRAKEGGAGCRQEVLVSMTLSGTCSWNFGGVIVLRHRPQADRLPTVLGAALKKSE